MQDTILRVEGICKYFPGVKALDGVTFEIRRGEVHAVCGENGAGKSTFIKILTGAIEPTSGTIEFEGIKYGRFTPRQSMELGINVIYQEFSLIPCLSVAENIFYGRELKKGFIRDVKTMNERALSLCQEMGVEMDITARVCDLGVAYQQIVEILKAVSQKSKLIIMDEPTAPLTVRETQIFFGIIEKLKKDQVTIIFISHRLEEVFQICDQVTVFCDGAYIVTRQISDISQKQLISHMVGRELTDDYPAPKRTPGETVLKVENLRNKHLNQVSFQLKKGEILGFGGLVGAGRTELARAIFGADPIWSGQIFLHGEPYRPKAPGDALKAGLGLIPEDRKHQGVILSQSVKENIVYCILKSCSKGLVILKKTECGRADGYISEMNIKTPGRNQLVKNLSGGNQQKVVLGKIMAANCDILIFDEPTRGIDVGAKYEIYLLMCRLADAGKSIIMISSDMPELIGMSDRILVMGGGRITGELQRGEFMQESILEMASCGYIHGC